MKIALISDIHDNVWNLQKALVHPHLQSTEALLCCGDLCSPFIIKLLGQGYSKPIHLVLGNNDGDVAAIIVVAKGFSNINIHGEYYRGNLGGLSIVMNHYPEKAQKLAEIGGYDVVCHGHDHVLEKGKKIGRTLVLNPGSIMGYHGGQLQDTTPTFLILDTERLTTEVIEL